MRCFLVLYKSITNNLYLFNIITIHLESFLNKYLLPLANRFGDENIESQRVEDQSNDQNLSILGIELGGNDHELSFGQSIWKYFIHDLSLK